jgi:hypothetical protein
MTRGKFFRRASFVVALVVVSWLAYGPLFAWSPITPGFRTTRTLHTVILFRDPPGLGVMPAAVEASLVRLQSNLGLDFDSPARFLLCDEWSDLTRFTPWLRVSHDVGAITLPIGLATYVTPVVRNRDDLLDFLAHESAHTLLYQHASIRHRLEMERQGWFVEGVAVHFGNPTAYEAWDEFRRASPPEVLRAIDPALNLNQRGVGGFRFSYSAGGYFVGYLIQRFGQDRFRDFTRAYVVDPAAYRIEFQRIFATSFDDGVQGFAGLTSEPHGSH